MDYISQNSGTVNTVYVSVRHSFDHETKSRIHQHLMDINDIITEEDIRNVKIGIPSPNPAIGFAKRDTAK